MIAKSIPDRIGEAWSTARIDTIFYPDSIFYSGEYIAPGNEKPKSFPIDREATRAFVQIRELFKLAGKPLWCRASFEIHSDGKFKMNWGTTSAMKMGSPASMRKRRSSG